MLAYWKMLWLNRLAGFRTHKWTADPRNRWKRLASYGALGMMMLAAYAAVIALEMLIYFLAQEIGDPEAVIALAFLGCMLITLIYSFFSVISQLFFGKDMAFLAALPIRSQGILLVKLSNVLLSEIALALAICVPILIRHGIAIDAGFGYYVRGLLGILMVPCIPVAITTALAFLLIRISALWKRREGVTTIAAFLFMALIIVGEMMLTLNVEEEQMNAAILGLLFGRASITRLLTGMYPPLAWLIKSLSSWNYALLFAAVSALTVALVIFGFGGSYMSLAIKQSEIRQHEKAGARQKKRSERVRSPFWALYRQEMKEVITVPAYATNCLAGAVMFPAMMIIMYITVQSEQSGPSLTMLTQLLDPALYLAMAAGVLSLTCVMNMAVPTAVSREGARHDMRRTYPVHGRVQLGAKLLMGLSYNAVTAIICAAVLCALFPAFVAQTLIALVISQIFSLLWSLISLMIDVVRPKFNWKNETEAVKQSINSLLGMLAGILVLAVLAGAAVLCWYLKLSMEAVIAVQSALMVVTCLFLWKWMANTGAQMYSFKEFSNL